MRKQLVEACLQSNLLESVVWTDIDLFSVLGSHALNLDCDREINLRFNFLNVELIHKIHVREQELTLGVESDSAHFLEVQVLEDLLFEGFHSSFVVNQDAP